MSYYVQQLDELAKAIRGKADQIRDLEKARVLWSDPKSTHTFWLADHIRLFREDGTVNPALVGVQREVLAEIDRQLFKRNSEIEGLRFRLVKLGRDAA